MQCGMFYMHRCEQSDGSESVFDSNTPRVHLWLKNDIKSDLVSPMLQISRLRSVHGGPLERRKLYPVNRHNVC